ncbi:MAG: hypothetical protein ACI9FR_000731 [Cryomorphaceae bacterium]|jgi:hypothetical protein
MGILKVSDKAHNEIRRSANVMSRSINAQAEFWLHVDHLAERNPDLNYQQIISKYFFDEVDSGLAV